MSPPLPQHTDARLISQRTQQPVSSAKSDQARHHSSWAFHVMGQDYLEQVSVDLCCQKIYGSCMLWCMTSSQIY